jgi:hypothetical protein
MAFTIVLIRCWGSPQPVLIKTRLPLFIFEIAVWASITFSGQYLYKSISVLQNFQIFSPKHEGKVYSRALTIRSKALFSQESNQTMFIKVDISTLRLNRFYTRSKAKMILKVLSGFFGHRWFAIDLIVKD